MRQQAGGVSPSVERAPQTHKGSNVPIGSEGHEHDLSHGLLLPVPQPPAGSAMWAVAPETKLRSRHKPLPIHQTVWPVEPAFGSGPLLPATQADAGELPLPGSVASAAAAGTRPRLGFEIGPRYPAGHGLTPSSTEADR